MKSETTASTAIPHPAIAMPVWPVGTNSLWMPRRRASRSSSSDDGHLPDRAVGADGQDDRRAVREVRARSGRSGRAAACAGRAARRRARARARRARRRRRRTRAGRSRCRGPARIASFSSSRHAGGKRPPCVATPTSAAVGSYAQRLGDRADDREAVLASRPARVRVEQRDDVLGAVAHHAARGLAVVRVGGAALGEDQEPTRAQTPSPGASAGSCTPSTNATPGHGSSREQEVAVEVDVVHEARDVRARRDAEARTRPCSRASRRARARGPRAPCAPPRGSRPTSRA